MQTVWTRAAARVAALGLWVCACGPGAAGGSTPEAGAEAGADTESETDSNETVVDLPPEPECPASLGELVSCECGFVEGCAIASDDGNDCTLACERAAACELARCNFDLAHGDPVCVELDNSSALTCVLEALLSGLDVRVDLLLDNTYPFAAWSDRRSLIRLDSTQWLMIRDFSEFYDTGWGSSQWQARVATVTDAELQACADAEFAGARFDCLLGLWWSAAQGCDDPQALACTP